MRRLLLLIAVLLLPLSVSRAEDKIIYPRTPATVGALPDKPGTGVSPMLLVSALIAASAGCWLLWRQRRSPHGLTGSQARKLSVAETRPLGNRQYLVVADYEGRKFLLGVCPGRIDMLSPIGDDPRRIP